MDKVTLTMFSQIVSIWADTTRARYERELDIVDILLPGLTEEQKEDIPLEDIDRMIDDVINTKEGEVFPTITIGDRTFTLVGDPDNFKIKYGQYRIFEKCVTSGDTDYLHKFIASIYTDESTPEERAEYFLHNMPMTFVVKPLMTLHQEVERRSRR